MEILTPFFERRPNQLTRGLPFEAYQELPGVNSSVLKNPTTLQMLHYVTGIDALPKDERALAEMTGADVSTVLERVEAWTPRMVPIKLAKFRRAPEKGEKATPAQVAMLETLAQAPLNSRELNSSTLKALVKNGWAEYQDSETSEVKISDAVKADRARSLCVGKATHTAILEPHMFDSEEWGKHYQLSPTSTLTSMAALALLEEDPSRELITPEIIDTARRCRDAVYKNKDCRRLLEAPGDSEVTIEAWDEKAQVMRKCRIDRLPKDPSLGIIDIKTTASGVRKRDMRGACWKWSYGAQMSFYQDTLALIEGKQRERVEMIFATTKAPFMARKRDLAQVPADESFIADGYEQYSTRLAMFVLAYMESNWEAYENEGPESLGKGGKR